MLAGPDLEVVAARLAAWVDTAETGGAARWWRSLGGNGDWDAWLIGWPRESGIDLHDHGGSSAVVTVLAGCLRETFVRPDGLRRRTLVPGRPVWLPPGHVHDLVNRNPAPALSVHVYSPPLGPMTYYGRTAGSAAARSLVG